MSEYAVVHIVAQESFKGLIGPQVVDHMAWHASSANDRGPGRVVVALLEPARIAIRGRFRARVAELQARAPAVRVIGLPYLSRFDAQRNAWMVARRIRQETGDLRVAFHCRGENAADWAIALRPMFPESAIILDVRGPWPEELMFARGYDGPDSADPSSRREYFAALGRLQDILAQCDRVLSVSPGMLDWLRGVGVSGERLTYVPCCANCVVHSAETRLAARERLGLTGKLVLVYLGIVTRYQNVEGGAIPFVEHAVRCCKDVHLLVVTPDAEVVREALAASSIPKSITTVLTLPQHEVAKTLVAGDAGFLLRTPSRLTRVVQPVKLGEYLGAGVPVIVSRGAGRVDDMIKSARAGVVTNFGQVSGANDGEEVRRVMNILATNGSELRQNAEALCAKEFAWSAHGAKVQAAYEGALLEAKRRELAEIKI